MKYSLGAAALLVIAFVTAVSGVNEYFFYAAFVVLQFMVLATAWNILGGYAAT
jgi:branched-chain amino acid transport system permease protein